MIKTIWYFILLIISSAIIYPISFLVCVCDGITYKLKKFTYKR